MSNFVQMVSGRTYPHLKFTKNWTLTPRDYVRLGQCHGWVSAICNTPILPEYYDMLMLIALKKGAQATTAIEGNTLNDEEVERIIKGENLPPSKEYQQIEVQNIVSAFNELLKETVYEGKSQLISPEFLLRLHRMVGQNLGEHFDAIPGRFRENEVTVGSYRCPDHRDIVFLIEKYCHFMRDFKYTQGKQEFSDVFIQAIVAHVYLEWIHPFGDGNGRTGRLLEFYILSRGENPDITLHILSNHYNNTRPEYYRQLDKASKTGDLTEFIQYALLGFRDGLKMTMEKIQLNQLQTFWQKYVYDTFNNIPLGGHRDTFTRRRTLALEIPIDRKFKLSEIPDLNIPLARTFSGISERTLVRDIEELEGLKIIIWEGRDLFANIAALNKMFAKTNGLLTPAMLHQSLSTVNITVK